jgi:hypothetical protein
MFITAAKIATVEAITAAFNAIGTPSSNTTVDLVPRSVTIEYPVEEIEWPAIYVQFRPTVTQYTGLNPDTFTAVVNNEGVTTGWEQIRHGYFEGAFDLQILAMSSEERDKIWETIINFFMMDGVGPSSSAFYSSIAANDLIGITYAKGSVIQVGDTVSPGTPWSPEELTYETTLRIKCIGEFYENKYTQTLLPISAVNVTANINVPTPWSYPITNHTEPLAQ